MCLTRCSGIFGVVGLVIQLRGEIRGLNLVAPSAHDMGSAAAFAADRIALRFDSAAGVTVARFAALLGGSESPVTGSALVTVSTYHVGLANAEKALKV